MKTWLKILSLMAAGMQRRLRELPELAVRSGFLVLQLCVFTALWRTVTVRVVTRPGGYALSELTWYLAFAEAIVFTTPSNSELELDREVRNGDIAYRIARPIAFPLYHMAVACGDRWTRFAFNLLVASLFSWLLVGPLHAPASLIGAGIAAGLCAVLVDELNTLGISLTSFWIENTTGLHLLYRRALLLLGGALIPLEAYPHWAARICQRLPFLQLVAAPSRLFVGRAADGVLGPLVMFACVSAVWVAITYGFGVRRLVAQGG